MFVLGEPTRFFRTALLAGVAATLTGCAITTPTITVDRIRPGHGYVVTVIHSNRVTFPDSRGRELAFQYELQQAGRTRPVSGRLLPHVSGELELLELPAGRYRWTTVRYGDNELRLTQQSGFQVETGAITYLGDINCDLGMDGRVQAASVRVMDNEAAITEQLRSAHGRLASRYPIGKQLMRMAPGVAP